MEASSYLIHQIGKIYGWIRSPHYLLGFLCGSAGKESTCSAGDLGSVPAWEDPLEKGKATYSSILAWRTPWTVSSMGLQRVGQDEPLSLSLLL